MLFYCILLVFFAAVHQGASEKSYDGWTLIRAHPETVKQVAFLTDLRATSDASEIQIWQQGSLSRPFELFVSPNAKAQFLAKLDEAKIKYEIKSDNIQEAIDAEKVPVASRARAGFRNSAWFSKFLKLEEINSAIQTLAKQFPDIVQVQSIGKTHEGRPINMVKVSKNDGRAKPAIWLDGGIHAREWASPATVLYMLNKLVSGYKTNSTIQRYVDSATWYIVPVLNPDGYSFTHSGDRMWRKNRRPGNRRGCEGVDLNRNFDYVFGGEGTSGDPCDDIYRGPSAFSEPESQAVRDFVTSHKDIKAFLTIHAYSQMWFYPFADDYNSYSADRNELDALARKAAEALRRVHGTRYDVGTAADLLYPAAGGSDDWAKGKANIKYVFCLELRPNGNSPTNGFILPPREIIPTGEETFAGLSVVADAVVGSASG